MGCFHKIVSKNIKYRDGCVVLSRKVNIIASHGKSAAQRHAWAAKKRERRELWGFLLTYKKELHKQYFCDESLHLSVMIFRLLGTPKILFLILQVMFHIMGRSSLQIRWVITKSCSIWKSISVFPSKVDFSNIQNIAVLSIRYVELIPPLR